MIRTDRFGPLIATLDAYTLSHPEELLPRRVSVAPALRKSFPSIYDAPNGEVSFKTYVSLAEKEGIVELGTPGGLGFEWIRLKEGKSRVRFSPLVKILSGLPSTPLPTHAHVCSLLTIADFRQGNEDTWKGYLKAAIAENVVVVGPTKQQGVSWIALPSCTTTAHPLPLPRLPEPTPPPRAVLPPPFVSTIEARQLVDALLTLSSDPQPLRSTVLDLLLQRNPTFRSSGSSGSEEIVRKSQEAGLITIGGSGSSSFIRLVRDHYLVVGVVAAHQASDANLKRKREEAAMHIPGTIFVSSLQARQLVEVLLTLPLHPNRFNPTSTASPSNDIPPSNGRRNSRAGSSSLNERRRAG